MGGVVWVIAVKARQVFPELWRSLAIQQAAALGPSASAPSHLLTTEAGHGHTGPSHMGRGVRRLGRMRLSIDRMPGDWRWMGSTPPLEKAAHADA